MSNTNDLTVVGRRIKPRPRTVEFPTPDPWAITCTCCRRWTVWDKDQNRWWISACAHNQAGPEPRWT